MLSEGWKCYISKSCRVEHAPGSPNSSPPASALATAPLPPPPNKSSLSTALNNTQQLERARFLGTGNPKVVFELIVSYIKVA